MNTTHDYGEPCEALASVRQWKTFFHQNPDGHAECGIYYERRPGHAYSVARCPRYVREAEWLETSNRMITCAQACAGLTDPEVAIQAARDALVNCQHSAICNVNLYLGDCNCGKDKALSLLTPKP